MTPIMNILPDGTYIQKLFDPIQSHAIYGVDVKDAPEMKDKLKQCGAFKFRVIKNVYNKAVICFALRKGAKIYAND